MKARIALAVFLFAAAARAGDDACPDRDPLRRPYFGDTHVHTRFSLDAGLQGTRMTPAQAYEFARGADMPIQPFDAMGKPLRHLRLARPLELSLVRTVRCEELLQVGPQIPAVVEPAQNDERGRRACLLDVSRRRLRLGEHELDWME